MIRLINEDETDGDLGLVDQVDAADDRVDGGEDINVVFATPLVVLGGGRNRELVDAQRIA